MSDVKRHLNECYRDLEELKELIDPEAQDLKKKALNDKLSLLSNVNMMILSHKVERHTKRKKRRKAKQIASRDNHKRSKLMRNFMESAIDEWQMHKTSQDQLLQENEIRKQEEKYVIRQHENSQKGGLAVLIARLEQLRRLRSKRQGIPLEENKYIPASDIENPVVDEEQFSDDEEEELFISEEYYYEAYESLKSMVNIRSQWDRFIVPKGAGTRIPIHFIPPPSNPLGQWKEFVNKPV